MPDIEGEPTESDVDALLHEFKGDHRSAIHALLHDLWVTCGAMWRPARSGSWRAAVRR